MSSHDGVSCDACGKNNFRSKRYKCLICYDYDLCSTCYEQGETSSNHTMEHPMQCILTRQDFDFYYNGERYASDQAQSFTCPFCGEMGFSLPFSQDSSLSNSLTQNFDLFHHLQLKHCDDQQTSEVICPICASMVNGDPNMLTPDLLSHIANDHQHVTVQTPSSAGSSANIFSRQSLSNRDFDFSGSPSSRATFRRGPLRAPSRRGTLGRGSGTVSQHFVDPSTVGSGTDPIADLLTQLSAVRRLAAASNNSSSTSGSTPSSSISLHALTRQQYERERLRAAARSHHNSSSSNQQTQSTQSSTSNSTAPSSSSTVTMTTTTTTTTTSSANPTMNVLQAVDSDLFDSFFSSALCIDPTYSSSSSNSQQTWAQVVAQQQQSTPTLDQQTQQSNPIGSLKSISNEPDPSLLRKIYEEGTSSNTFSNQPTHQQKRRSDFLHSFIFSSFLCPLNDNDK